VRIGVTGHRVIADAEAVAGAVDRALDQVLGGACADSQRPIEVWSSLADGADRLVVHRVLTRPHATLVAVLPLEPDEYRTDFDAASALEFDQLVEVADTLQVTGAGPSGSRRAAASRRTSAPGTPSSMGATCSWRCGTVSRRVGAAARPRSSPRRAGAAAR
jgi:hypothetical protein